MAARGVDPNRFLEWFEQEGVSLTESELPSMTAQWLNNELLVENWWNQPQQQAPQQQAPSTLPAPIAQAMMALGNLSKTLVNSKVKQHPLTRDNKLMISLHQLLGILRGISTRSQIPNQVAQPIQPQYMPEPAQQAPAQQAPTENVLHKLEQRIIESKLTKICESLESQGVDPKEFTDWYKENHHLPLVEFTQGIRDWWGRMKQRFNNAAQGWQSGGQDYDTERENQVIAQSVQQTVQALQGLEQHIAANPGFGGNDLKPHLDAVLKAIQAPQTQPTPQLPQNPPEQFPQQTTNDVQADAVQNSGDPFMESLLRMTSPKNGKWFI